MSKHDTDTHARPGDIEDQLWDGGNDAGDEVRAAAEPGFNNAEGRLAVDESMVDEAQFAVPSDESPDSAPQKKRSNVAFYAVLGTFAVAAVGLVGYKAGLFGHGSKPPLEPITLAQSATPAAAPAKKESMLSGGSGDLLSGSAASASAKPPTSVSAMESDLFGESAARVSTPVAAAPEAQTPAAVKVEPAAEVVPVSQPPVEKVAVVEKPAQLDKEPTRKEVPAAAAAAKPVEVRKPRATRTATVKVAKKPVVKPEVAVASQVKRRAVVLASAKKGKTARGPKDPRPDAPEVMTGWSLRGTWPSHGPSQRAWIADEQGRVTTVSVGQYVSGAKVISIGKRGEMVLTTAGQIVP